MSTLLRFSADDLASLPDTMDDTRYELIDGELSVSRQPHWAHQFANLMTGAALQTWSRQTGLGVANIAPGLIFSAEADVAPDVVWMSRARRAASLRADGKLYIAPELVVEILSPGSTNERRDRELKLKMYAREGVDEYWLVNWRTRTVEVYRRAGEQLALAQVLTDDDHLTSPLLPGFALPISDLWEPVLD
jgi:Uma2 family endonuclease